MPDNGLPQFSRTNVVAAIVIAAFSAGVVACTLYAPELGRAATVISLFLIVCAGVLHIPLSNLNGQPTVNVERADSVTQNNPAPDPRPDHAAQRAPADRAAAVNQPASRHSAPSHRTVYVPTRDAKGHYAKPPPLDIHADH